MISVSAVVNYATRAVQRHSPAQRLRSRSVGAADLTSPLILSNFPHRNEDVKIARQKRRKGKKKRFNPVRVGRNNFRERLRNVSIRRPEKGDTNPAGPSTGRRMRQATVQLRNLLRGPDRFG
ncbi:hypothetical protein EVAR_9402_1 [Eumeta japonica]|uniref:Uncharacterized protein n=1 Tax=Eumeta variegata TaxID=151549 RepID=A0A4C1UEE6_EUMVA|nr:hypothetical protein EVAR_9402_1 [Eumeta japonica]